MKFNYGIVLALLTHSLFASAQVESDRVQFVPDRPKQDQFVNLYYKRDSTIFDLQCRIKCKIYFTGWNELSEAVRMDFPQVMDLDLTGRNNLLYGSFYVPANAIGMVAVFLDSLEKNIDNNHGEGYWVPIFNKIGEPIVGSISSIAQLYVSGWDPGYAFHLSRRIDVARRLYEKDFGQNAEIKRNFIRYYLATFDINDENDKALFKAELNRYIKYGDLDEWELKTASNSFMLINEIDSAKKYQELVFKRYPHGSWALQTESLKPAMQIGIERNFEKQKRLYRQFKDTYCRNYPDEFTRRVMTSRKAHILKDMVLSYVKHNKLAGWLEEVEGLDEEFKNNTYDRTSKFLIDRENSKYEDVHGSKSEGSQLLESRLLLTKLNQDKTILEFAEKLSRSSANYLRRNLEAKRTWTEKPFLSDKDIRDYRELQLAESLNTFGQTQVLQNKIEEASEILQEAAIKLAKRKEPEINEHYIESLVKSNRIKEALIEAETVIRLGKSSEKIDDFHRAIVTDHSLLKEESMVNLSLNLKKRMVSEITPDFSLIDAVGNSISIKDLKGKTVVIDFWATWCPPCIAGLESMATVVHRYKDDGDVVFLFVNTERITEETKKRATELLYEKNYGFALYFDPEFRTTTSFRVQSIPTKIVIDKEGKMRFLDSGLIGSKQEQVNELIAMIELVR
jgi:thiol-disulfide isomerase/thioredoxin